MLLSIIQESAIAPQNTQGKQCQHTLFGTKEPNHLGIRLTAIQNRNQMRRTDRTLQFDSNFCKIWYSVFPIILQPHIKGGETSLVYFVLKKPFQQQKAKRLQNSTAWTVNFNQSNISKICRSCIKFQHTFNSIKAIEPRKIPRPPYASVVTGANSHNVQLE